MSVMAGVVCFLLATALVTELATAEERLHELQGGESQSSPTMGLTLPDDLGSGAPSSYGASDLQTPNVDHLVAKGMRLNQLYANSSIRLEQRPGGNTQLSSENNEEVFGARRSAPAAHLGSRRGALAVVGASCQGQAKTRVRQCRTASTSSSAFQKKNPDAEKAHHRKICALLNDARAGSSDGRTADCLCAAGFCRA